MKITADVLEFLPDEGTCYVDPKGTLMLKCPSGQMPTLYGKAVIQRPGGDSMRVTLEFGEVTIRPREDSDV